MRGGQIQGRGGDMLVGAEEEGVAAWLLPVTVSCWVMRGGRRRGEKQRMEAAEFRAVESESLKV